jgi:anthranilate phosphoribosyltransferase
MAQEHPFAQYVRILARGPGRSRAMTFDEARAAMRMIAAGEAEPIQLGAMLMLMRYRQETSEELAGFVAALRENFATPPGPPRVELDWPSYAAGRTRGAPWFLLSALLLAENGVRVLMHGPEKSVLARSLASLGIALSATPAAAAARLEADSFAFLPLAAYAPVAQQLLDLRPLLGLRSPANSLARLLNPLGAPNVIQGVFHPAYRDLQRGAAALLGQKRLAVFKGGGGEAERNPDKSCRVFVLDDGRNVDEDWPALDGDAVAANEPEPSLTAIWRGDAGDDAPVRIVIATAALALRLTGRAPDPAAADALARTLWARRDRARYPVTALASAGARSEPMPTA